jgi:L-rhamnose-H+ transport protein
MAAVGAVAAVAAGLLNGSWNLPTKPDAPRLVNAAMYWEWEQIWLVANVLIVVFNTFLVLGVVGASTLGDVYGGASVGELGSICAFSLLWGFGGVGYGQAIKRVGMALGTSIVMAQIVCIGTLLPLVLALEAGDMTTQEIVGSVAGVLLACAGFAMSSRAGLLRDAGGETATVASADVEGVMEVKSEVLVADVAVDSAKGSSRSTFVESMAWCVAGGVLSSMLQFAFVFGGGLVDDAEEAGVSKEAAAMPVWMLCFLFNSVGHVGYASRLLTTNDTWRKFRSTTYRDWAHGSVMCRAHRGGVHGPHPPLRARSREDGFVGRGVRVASGDVFDGVHGAGVVVGVGGVGQCELGGEGGELGVAGSLGGGRRGRGADSCVVNQRQ